MPLFGLGERRELGGGSAGEVNLHGEWDSGIEFWVFDIACLFQSSVQLDE